MNFHFVLRADGCTDEHCLGVAVVTSKEGGMIVVGKRVRWRDRRKLGLKRGERPAYLPSDIARRIHLEG